MNYTKKVTASVLVSLTALAGGNAFAGRPLAVDDANVNDAGSGHVEVFFQRGAGGVNTSTVAPAYGLTEGVEIAAALSGSQGINTGSAQVKIRLTPSRKDGCNFATSLGLSQPGTAGAGFTSFYNGLMSCNMDTAGSVHVNLGVVSPPAGGASTTVWGIAYEREFGAFTGHIEAFGAKDALPTAQVGLRTMLTKSLQLDGSVGRTNDESIYSVGVKFLF